MSTIAEELAYLKGLAEGLFHGASDDATVTVVRRLISLSEIMAAKLQENESGIETLKAYIETVDEDLDRLERSAYGMTEEASREGECPVCREKFIYDADIIGSGKAVECPACSNSVVLKAAEQRGD